MSAFFTAGWVTGLGTAVWTFVMGLTGWYKNPAMLWLFFLVVVLEVAMLVRALRTHADTNTWYEQVRGGITTRMVASPFVFVGSYLFTRLAFPSYFVDVAAMGADMMRARGASETDIHAYVTVQQAQSHLSHAMTGVVGTMSTAILVAAIGGLFLRRRR